PRWEARTTRAPRWRVRAIVGRTARIRASSITSPSRPRGTLKSTRRKTRQPPNSTSSTVRLAMSATRRPPGRRPRPGLERPAQEPDKVPDAAGVPPLVVVPREDLDQGAVDNRRRQPVDDGGMGIAVEVHRDERLVGIGEEVLSWARG